jgi:hypothetical protein
MTTIRHLSICVIAASLTALTPLRAQSVQNAVTDLAQLWSGTKRPPHCTRARALTPIEKQLAAFDCTWAAPLTPPGGMISGTIHASSGYSVVTWQRPTLDPDDANRVRDSLATTLEAIGLKESICGKEGDDSVGLWIGNALAVHVTRIVESNGIPRLQVIATTDLANTSAIHCARR